MYTWHFLHKNTMAIKHVALSWHKNITAMHFWNLAYFWHKNTMAIHVAFFDKKHHGYTCGIFWQKTPWLYLRLGIFWHEKHQWLLHLIFFWKKNPKAYIYTWHFLTYKHQYFNRWYFWNFYKTLTPQGIFWHEKHQYFKVGIFDMKTSRL